MLPDENSPASASHAAEALLALIKPLRIFEVEIERHQAIPPDAVIPLEITSALSAAAVSHASREVFAIGLISTRASEPKLVIGANGTVPDPARHFVSTTLHNLFQMISHPIAYTQERELTEQLVERAYKKHETRLKRYSWPVIIQHLELTARERADLRIVAQEVLSAVERCLQKQNPAQLSLALCDLMQLVDTKATLVSKLITIMHFDGLRPARAIQSLTSRTLDWLVYEKPFATFTGESPSDTLEQLRIATEDIEDEDPIEQESERELPGEIRDPGEVVAAAAEASQQSEKYRDPRASSLMYALLAMLAIPKCARRLLACSKRPIGPQPAAGISANHIELIDGTRMPCTIDSAPGLWETPALTNHSLGNALDRLKKEATDHQWAILKDMLVDPYDPSPSTKHVHAEIAVAVAILRMCQFSPTCSTPLTTPVVIGVSKLCCFPCAKWFEGLNDLLYHSDREAEQLSSHRTAYGLITGLHFIVAGSHGKAYPGWVSPDLSSIDPKLHNDLARRLARDVCETMTTALPPPGSHTRDSSGTLRGSDSYSLHGSTVISETVV